MKNPPYTLLQVGSDAELFLWDLRTNSPVPVCGLLGGTKAEPRPIYPDKKEYKGYMVQEDNVLIEYNIPPCTTSQSFSQCHVFMRNYLQAFFHKQNKNWTTWQKASHMFPIHELQTEQAQSIGCEPDYCVWTDTENSPKDSPLIKEGFRTTGFHLHFSYLVGGKSPDIEQMKRLVKLNDLFLGLHSLHFDNDPSRRKLYGQAGAFRPKPYGHEYRVLSGLFSGSEDYSRDFFNKSVEMFYWLNSVGEKHADNLLNEIGPDIVNAINNGDNKSGNRLSAMIRS